MKYGRDARRAIDALRGVDAEVFKLIESLESVELVAVPELCVALTRPTITLLGISCVKGEDGQGGVEIGRNGFFDKKIKAKSERLRNSLVGLGKEVRTLIFVEDLEFRRVWGWSQSQKDLTDECEFQIELAREEGKIPHDVEVKLWSLVEPEAISAGCRPHEDALAWAIAPPQSLALDTVARYRQACSRDKGATLAELRKSSVVGLAEHSLVGEALETLYPEAVFLQTADHRRNHMLQYRRNNPLPIVHPWK